MTPQAFFNQVLATTKPVGTGQCGELVDFYLVDVYGNHTSYDNAIDYWNNGIPGFSVVTTPGIGDIACYNAHPGYPAGHIAIYAGNGEVFEQNADPDGSLPHYFARATTYLLGYLRYNGENMNPTSTQAGAAYAAFATQADGITPGMIDQADLNVAVSTPWAEWIPNFYPGVQTLRNTIYNLTQERDKTLYPFVNAVCTALSIPVTTDPTVITKAISDLQNNPDVLSPGVYQVK